MKLMSFIAPNYIFYIMNQSFSVERWLILLAGLFNRNGRGREIFTLQPPPKHGRSPQHSKFNQHPFFSFSLGNYCSNNHTLKKIGLIEFFY
ncbi:hypothetical protein BGS_0666 [Beggiatoa sp. SS]|nr:hypothetical protein BGS_0666 [Beggiatoa sp. SS]